MLSNIEEKAGAIVSCELGLDFLKGKVVFTAGLEEEFVKEEGLVELEMSSKRTKRIRQLFKILVGSQIVKALVNIKDIVVIAVC